MNIGFALPVSGTWNTPDAVRTVATRAEELGYHSLWTFQRLLCDVDAAWGPVYRSVLDPIVTLSYVSAVTSRIRLGVAVVNLPFVSPVLLAKQASTLDLLAAGRLDLGLGLGWADEEYVASGVTKEHRGRRADDFITALTNLLTEDVVEHAGPFYTVPRTRMQPKRADRPAILLGANAPEALRRAGRLTDGWISSSRVDPTRLGESVAVVKRAAERAGRDPESLRFICRGVVKVRATGERAALTGTLAEIRADLAVLAAQGITETFIDLNFDPEISAADADPAQSLRRAEDALTALAPS